MTKKGLRQPGSTSGDGATSGAGGRTRRALLVSDSELLVTGVTTLFKNEMNLEIRLARLQDEGALLEEIDQWRPHVIILDEATEIMTPFRLLALLEDFAHIRLVRVSARDAALNVYDRRNSVLNQLSEFFAAVANQ